MDREPVIWTAELGAGFGDTTVLEGVDLDVPPGVILGLIGPSGSGKTTLIRVLTGVLAPSTGDVEVLGTDPARFTADERRRFGYMPQRPVLYPTLSLWSNLHVMASLYGLPHRGRKRRFTELLDFVDLLGDRRKKLADTSGGMHRRLMLAAALVHDPELVFLDEPTAGIDPLLRQRLWDQFRLLRDEGRTVVVSTQYVGEAAMCDLVAVIGSGRLLRLDTPEGLRRHAMGGDLLDVCVGSGWPSPDTVARLRVLRGVRDVHPLDDGLRFVVDDADQAVDLLTDRLRLEQVDVRTVEPVTVPFDEVFIELMRQERELEDVVP
jgi:ABC-2 type transport system ATP-binding protein